MKRQTRTMSNQNNVNNPKILHPTETKIQPIPIPIRINSNALKHVNYKELYKS